MARTKCVVKGVARGKWRTVALLQDPESKQVNVLDALAALDDVAENRFRRRFRTWAGGVENSKHYHGFKGKNRNCFVFRSNEHRIYGFLCQPKADARFRLCCLTTHATKHQHKTDQSILNRVSRLAEEPRVLSAIDEFMEGGDDENLERLD